MDHQQSQPEEQIEYLEKYLRIALYLVSQEARLQKPILLHPTLQLNNIFVCKNLNFIGIIGCQHLSVLPRFLATGVPKYFQNCHDDESLRCIPPKLPESLTKMDDEEHAEALGRFRRRHLHLFYLGFVQRYNPSHFDALDRQLDLLTRKVFDHAGEPREENISPQRSDLVHINQKWQQLMDDKGYAGKDMPLSPISFTELDA